MRRPTVGDVLAALGVGLILGTIAGAQGVMWRDRDRDNCIEVIGAERACMARVADLTDRLAALLTTCGYGRGGAPRTGA